jgi:uncharacterized protein YabN with tetrapyrrole methylase and pyrophosphatase domain
MESQRIEQIEEEIGDLLFSIANLARKMKLNPELVLQKTNDKFQTRFHFIEKSLREKGKTFEETSVQEMNDLWEKAKKTMKEPE